MVEILFQPPICTFFLVSFLSGISLVSKHIFTTHLFSGTEKTPKKTGVFSVVFFSVLGVRGYVRLGAPKTDVQFTVHPCMLPGFPKCGWCQRPVESCRPVEESASPFLSVVP